MTTLTKITSDRINVFDFRNYSPEHVGQLASQFQTAEPFPHVVLENFLNLRPDEMAGVYPAPEWPHWNKRNDYYQSGKMYCRDTDILPPLISSMFYELSSPPYWQQHGSHTGIDRLRIRLYRVLTRAVRRLSRMAHQANPNKESR